MMKIFNASQVRLIDKETIEQQQITSLELMERASAAVCEELLLLLSPQQKVYVFAGAGNNGGDALAIARLLQAKAFKVEVYLVSEDEVLSEDCRLNKERFELIGKITTVKDLNDIPQLPEKSIVIDGLFGSGLNRPLKGLYKQTVEMVNRSASTVYSIDIPSGMYMDDNSGNDEEAIVRAERVFTFQFPKLSLLLPESSRFCKEFSIVDIGLSDESISRHQTGYHYIEKSDVSSILKFRDKFSNKGDYGRAFLIAGSSGKMGAAVMAARSCLRSGVGLLTVHVPYCGVDIVQTSVPEAMVDKDANEDYITGVEFDPEKQTVGIGPGLGKAEQTRQMLEILLQKADKPMVIDADALNIISENERLKKLIPQNSILTPHPIEFDRLLGLSSDNGYKRLQSARSYAKEYAVYIILKGAYTATVTPEGAVYFNSTGNPGMATGGSGDVLTGILTSLLAQGYSSFETCILGVYLHGMAGDKAASVYSQYSMLASDVVDFLGDAFSDLSAEKKNQQFIGK